MTMSDAREQVIVPVDVYVEFLRQTGGLSYQKRLRIAFRSLMWEFISQFGFDRDQFKTCVCELYEKYDIVMSYFYVHENGFENFPTLTKEKFIENAFAFFNIPTCRSIAEFDWEVVVVKGKWVADSDPDLENVPEVKMKPLSEKTI